MVRLLSVKGQVFSSDFLIACTLFILVLIVLYGYWTYSYNEIEETRNIDMMIYKTNLASEAWFREGTPKYWDPSDIIEIGLMNDHNFNQTKMDSLNVSLGYNRTKSLLDITGYDYFFGVINATNHTIFSFGLYPSDSENIVKVKRIGILNETIVSVEVLVWI